MKPKSSSSPRGADGGISTRTPCAPQTTASPARTSLTGTLRTTAGRPAPRRPGRSPSPARSTAQPLAVEPDEGVEVGRRVEVVGEDAVGRRGPGERRPRVDRVGAVHLHPHDDALEQFGVLGADLDQRARLVLVLPAQVQALDAVVAAVLEDVVEDPGEDAGVHQVPGQGDGLGVRGWRSAHGRRDVSGYGRSTTAPSSPVVVGAVPHAGDQHARRRRRSRPRRGSGPTSSDRPQHARARRRAARRASPAAPRTASRRRNRQRRGRRGLVVLVRAGRGSAPRAAAGGGAADGSRPSTTLRPVLGLEGGDDPRPLGVLVEVRRGRRPARAPAGSGAGAGRGVGARRRPARARRRRARASARRARSTKSRSDGGLGRLTERVYGSTSADGSR